MENLLFNFTKKNPSEFLVEQRAKYFTSIKTSHIYHGLTGSKEAVMNSCKFDHTRSDNNIISYNGVFSQLAIPVDQRDILLHSSIDYNDGWQETRCFHCYCLIKVLNTTFTDHNKNELLHHRLLKDIG